VNVSLTPAAAAKIQDLAGGPATIRLFVSGRGCCRATYGLAFAEELEPDDTIVEASGVRLVIDAESRELCDGVDIDLLQTEGGDGFAVRGPRIGDGCGCQRQ
jgi:iron-sulfur cluster assembly accessory protein